MLIYSFNNTKQKVLQSFFLQNFCHVCRIKWQKHSLANEAEAASQSSARGQHTRVITGFG